MRRKDRQRTCAFAQQVLDACMYATLAMTDMQGRPYCVPINPVREGDALYFHAHWHRAPQVLRCGTVQPIYRSGFAHRSKLHKIPAFAFDKFSANFP